MSGVPYVYCVGLYRYGAGFAAVQPPDVISARVSNTPGSVMRWLVPAPV